MAVCVHPVARQPSCVLSQVGGRGPACHLVSGQHSVSCDHCARYFVHVDEKAIRPGGRSRAPMVLQTLAVENSAAVVG